MTAAQIHGPARVVREGDRVVIAGFDKLEWPHEQESSTMRCLAIALQTIGEPVTYEYLLGASGLAFRLQVYEPGWCPSSPHACVGADCAARAVAAVDYEEIGHEAKADDAAGVARVRKAIVASIDAGAPVIYHHYEDGLVVGYEKDGKVLLGRAYPGFGSRKDAGAGIYELTEWSPFAYGTLKKRARPVDRRAIAVNAIRAATEMWSTPRFKAGEDSYYTCGRAAYEAWIADLRDDSRFEKVDQKDFRNLRHHNAYIFYCLVECRTAAASYLHDVARLFEGEAADRVGRAAALYGRLRDLLTERCVTDVAAMPWMPGGKQWTADMRHAQADLLAKAADMDAAAIAELEKALAALATPSAQHSQVLLDDVVRIFGQVYGGKLIQRSAMATHLVCMRAAGWNDVDYADLMVLSGYGLSFAYHPKEKHYVSFMPPPGDAERITRATGFEWEWLSFKTSEECWTELKRTLDAGKPARAGWYEDLVFAGYRDAADKAARRVFVLCAPFAHPGKWWTWDEFEKWFKGLGEQRFGRHTTRVEAATPRETAVAMMKNIIAWSERHPLAEQQEHAGAKFGLAGIEAYADDVADASKTIAGPAHKTDYYFDRGWGCYCVYPQWTSRKCTATWLKRVARQLPEPAANRMLAAADEYEAAFAAWEEWEKQIGRQAHLPQADRNAGFDRAWASQERRQAGAAGVRKAIARERAAIAELEKALAAIK
ncbi:MAG: hypothetical protein BIFFINMI_01724 [Phycisphaerae bacterium]|nr:hypothetical protein [Phycisphaerae bacterium]